MARSAPSPALRDAYRAAMGAGRSRDVEAAWAALELAHVLSQPWAGMHVRVHLAMFRLGLRTHDGREIVGQAIRLAVAAPGSLTGRYPKGNSGRANVSMWKPMPLSDALAELVDPPVPAGPGR